MTSGSLMNPNDGSWQPEGFTLRQGVWWAPNIPRDISFPDAFVDRVDSSFWLDHRATVVQAMLQRYGVSALWDVGAGGGEMARQLRAVGIDVTSVEPLPRGAVACANHGGPVYCCELHDLRLPTGSLPAIGLFDVIEHLEDPIPLLLEATRILAPRGKLIVTVPAFQALWSQQDVSLGHFRRYTKQSLSSVMDSLGLQTKELRYLFMSLVLPAAILRTLPTKLGIRSDADAELDRSAHELSPGRLADASVRRILRYEERAARRVNLPFGLSVLGVWTKPSEGVGARA